MPSSFKDDALELDLTIELDTVNMQLHVFAPRLMRPLPQGTTFLTRVIRKAREQRIYLFPLQASLVRLNSQYVEKRDARHVTYNIVLNDIAKHNIDVSKLTREEYLKWYNETQPKRNDEIWTMAHHLGKDVDQYMLEWSGRNNQKDFEALQSEIMQLDPRPHIKGTLSTPRFQNLSDQFWLNFDYFKNTKTTDLNAESYYAWWRSVVPELTNSLPVPLELEKQIVEPLIKDKDMVELQEYTKREYDGKPIQRLAMKQLHRLGGQLSQDGNKVWYGPAQVVEPALNLSFLQKQKIHEIRQEIARRKPELNALSPHVGFCIEQSMEDRADFTWHGLLTESQKCKPKLFEQIVAKVEFDTDVWEGGSVHICAWSKEEAWARERFMQLSDHIFIGTYAERDIQVSANVPNVPIQPERDLRQHMHDICTINGAANVYDTLNLVHSAYRHYKISHYKPLVRETQNRVLHRRATQYTVTFCTSNGWKWVLGVDFFQTGPTVARAELFVFDAEDEGRKQQLTLLHEYKHETKFALELLKDLKNFQAYLAQKCNLATQKVLVPKDFEVGTHRFSEHEQVSVPEFTQFETFLFMTILREFFVQKLPEGEATTQSDVGPCMHDFADWLVDQGYPFYFKPVIERGTEVVWENKVCTVYEVGNKSNEYKWKLQLPSYPEEGGEIVPVKRSAFTLRDAASMLHSVTFAAGFADTITHE